ncbi:MAG: hypothetical protein GKS07_10995 [Nitrosopumilus sp.]|nr:MAG: hypothetical protein GKS07_00560 [Nitrosopumilus sp.]QMU55368.1 MAG: hypothetical protein GKS07_10995 [Nitrosopumilus sp.]
MSAISPEDAPSQADLLREWIDGKLDEDPKRYMLSSKLKEGMRDFAADHPQLKKTGPQIKASFHTILNERLKARNISPKDGKVTRKRIPKFNPNTSDMQAIVEPALQGAPIQQSQSDSRNDKFAPNTSQQQQLGPNGQPIPGMISPNQPYVNPNVTLDSIGGLAQGCMYGLKALLPDLEMLSDDEKKGIAEILMPPISRIEDEKIQLYLFPIIGILGIVGPKIAKARVIKKEKKIEEKKKQKIIKKAEKIPEKETTVVEAIAAIEENDEDKGEVGW